MSAVKASGDITRIDIWACSVRLPSPLDFGDFVIEARQFVALRVATRDGIVADVLGWTRGAPLDLSLATLGAKFLGMDALNTSALACDPLLVTAPQGRGGDDVRAHSMFEIALWDLKGQAAGVPVWRLLGGQPRTIPILLVEGYPLPGERDEDFAERIAMRVEAGFVAVKLEASSYRNPVTLRNRLRLIREMIGNSADLIVDMAWSWRSAADAVREAQTWAEYGLAWIEDPLPRHQVREMAKLRAQVDVPIAAGDESTRPAELLALLDGDAVDILRVDPHTNGGMAAVSALADRAAACRKGVSLHGYPEIIQHCAFAREEFAHIEAAPLDRAFDVAHRLIEKPLLTTATQTHADPPTEPGTGMRLDLQAVQAAATRHTVLRH